MTTTVAAADDGWPEVAVPGGGLPADQRPAGSPPVAVAAGGGGAVVDDPAAPVARPSPPAARTEVLAAGTARCRVRGCSAVVRPVVTEFGDPVRVDVDPVAGGLLVWVRTDAGWRMRVLEPGQVHEGPDARRWRMHQCARPVRHLAAVPDPAAADLEGIPAGLLELATPVEGERPDVTVVDTPAPRPWPVRRPVGERMERPEQVCVVPHETPRPARLYPGGLLCDGCVAAAAQARVVWLQEARDRYAPRTVMAGGGA